jgi:hypothetical protein
MALSKNFRMLMEDMRRAIPSNKSIDEDRDQRVKNREMRKRENQEGKFSDPSVSSQDRQYGVESSASGKFKINAFIKALEGLKSQIISKIIECDTRIKTDQTGTGVVAQKYKQKYLSFLDRIASLLGEIYSRKEKEGRKLEGDEDAIIIKAFRDNYNSILTELEEASKSFTTDIDTKAAEYLKGLKFKEITGPLGEADKLFAAASNKMNELIQLLSQQATSGSSGSSGSSGDVSTLTDTIKAGAKYANDSKEGKVVIAVKKTIYEKFGKIKALSGSKDWGVVYKSYPNVSGTLLANTQAVIKGIKAGLSDDYPELKGDTTGNITPAFVSALSKAKVNESASKIPGKLISFEDFIKSPKLTEGFNVDAATSAMSGKSSSSSRGSSSTKPKVQAPQFTATPFTTDAEGNDFRAWVNQKHADWAKSNDLSAAGPKNNNYIRKAYQEFGEEYKASKGAPESVKKEEILTNKQMKDLIDKASNAGAYCSTQLTADGDPILFFHSKNGMEYGHIYNNMKTYYRTTSGKVFPGKYFPDKNMVTFDEGGKSFSFDSVVKMQISSNLGAEESSSAQSKKAYVASSGEGYTNVRSGAFADTKGGNQNLIYKHDDKSKQIGVVISSQVTKGNGKINDYTWYKVQFPEKKNNAEFGWVRADTVDLK